MRTYTFINSNEVPINPTNVAECMGNIQMSPCTGEYLQVM